MLPGYIIDEIIKRERGKARIEEMIIECPEPSVSNEYQDDNLADEELPEDRGIVILDFTI